MTDTDWVKVHYFDASALVKLVIDEQHSDRVRAFFQNNTSFATTSMCLIEALGVLKRKWQRERISVDAYFAATRELIINAWGKRIELDSVELVDPVKHGNIERMAKTHGIDLSDSLQLVTILKGRYSVLGPNSASVLITADRGLATAAKAEGIRVWNCVDEPSPTW